MAEDLQRLVEATVLCCWWDTCLLDAVNFVAGNPEADPKKKLSERWIVEQLSELTAMTASFLLATPTEEYGAVAGEFNKPSMDIWKDKCSKCMRGCELHNNVGNFGS